MPQIGSHRIPPAAQAPARPQYGPGNMPPLPPAPLTGAAKMGAPAPQPLTVAATLAPPPIVRCFLVPPPNMPPLPPTPPPKPTWAAARNPTAQIVQRQYVDLRLEELAANQKPGQKLALEVLQALLLKQPRYAGHKKVPLKELKRIYDQVEDNLQSAELTINFNSNSWFSTENLYDTYTQMYQRNVVIKDGKMQMTGGGGGAADDRITADNQVTFPEHWQGTKPPVPPRRGLSPGLQSRERIVAQMHTGDLQRAGKAVSLGNKNFNPNTKQIFMALNYGRRPHGSTTCYGYSYLVLKNALKVSAFYYAGYTFLDCNRLGSIRQVSYDNLGSILGTDSTVFSIWGIGEIKKRLSTQILESCYAAKALPDTSEMTELLEAHHFGELRFRDHVDHMVISPLNQLGQHADNWPTIVENARKFAAKHGIKLYQTS